MKKKDRNKLAAILMAGQGALTALKPRRRGSFWRSEQKTYRNVMHSLNHNRSPLMKALGLAGAGLGAWWAWRQFRR